MERHSQLSIPDILDKLAHILAHKQSGTFYIATNANTSCRFAIESGKITHCTHKRDHGIAALLSLQETGGGSCSFSENQAIPFRTEAAVDHQASLDLLGLHPEIPPRQLQEPNTPATTSTPASASAKPAPVRYYRGQMAAQADTPSTQEAGKQTPPPATEAPKTKRFYRGG